jgi:hypothetical protein
MVNTMRIPEAVIESILDFADDLTKKLRDSSRANRGYVVALPIRALLIAVIARQLKAS